MNLNQIAGPAVSILSPSITATWRRSTGYTSDAAGVRTPTFATQTIQLQEQPLSSINLRHLDGLNITTVTRKAYANFPLEGVNRTTGKGGDLITYADPNTGISQTWLVTVVFEPFDGEWTSAGLTLQTPPIPGT